MARLVTIDRDTPILLPPDLRNWVPPGHLVRFIIDAIESIDTTSAQINHRGTGHESNTRPYAFGPRGLFILHWNFSAWSKPPATAMLPCLSDDFFSIEGEMTLNGIINFPD
jgi:hypothetical protein